MAILFVISRLDRDFSCSADGGPKFFVGRRVSYEGRIGLYNISAGSRLNTLKVAIAARPVLAQKRWSRDAQDFV